MNLSITIITLNEGKNIKKCLESIKHLDAEIILVDSGSTDNTLQIAKKYNAKIFNRSFDDFASQKNYALSKAEGDWILSVDADEELPKALTEEIRTAVENKEYAGFLIPRRNFILGKEIKHSRWSPDKHIWLWKKGFGQWKGEVHEEVVIQGPISELKTAKINHQDKDIATFIKKNDFYSTLYAKYLFRQGARFSLFHLIYDPFSEFFIRFFYKMGFLDGLEGFILSYLMSIYKISVWIKMYELEYSNK